MRNYGDGLTCKESIALRRYTRVRNRCRRIARPAPTESRATIFAKMSTCCWTRFSNAKPLCLKPRRLCKRLSWSGPSMPSTRKFNSRFPLADAIAAWNLTSALLNCSSSSSLRRIPSREDSRRLSSDLFLFVAASSAQCTSIASRTSNSSRSPRASRLTPAEKKSCRGVAFGWAMDGRLPCATAMRPRDSRPRIASRTVKRDTDSCFASSDSDGNKSPDWAPAAKISSSRWLITESATVLLSERLVACSMSFTL